MFNIFNQFPNPVRHMLVIIVQVGDKITRRNFQGFVERNSSGYHPPSEWIIGTFPTLFKIKEMYPGIPDFFQKVLGRVGTMVSRNNYFEVFVFLA